MIANMSDNEYIIVKEKYLIKLPQGEYDINGSTVTFNYSHQPVTADSIDNIFRISKSKPMLIGFTDLEGKSYGSVDDYLSLSAIAREGDLDGFENLDKEFEVKKALARYRSCKTVYSDPEIIKVKVDLKFAGSLEDTGSPFIQTALHVGQKTFNGTGIYKVLMSSIAKDEFNKATSGQKGFSNSTHSNIRYAQYSGTYIFTGADEHVSGIKGDADVKIVGTIEEAVATELALRTFVRKSINKHLQPISMKDIDPGTLTEFESLLRSIQSNLNATTATSKTSGSLTHARQNLNRALTKIMECIPD